MCERERLTGKSATNFKNQPNICPSIGSRQRQKICSTMHRAKPTNLHYFLPSDGRPEQHPRPRPLPCLQLVSKLFPSVSPAAVAAVAELAAAAAMFHLSVIFQIDHQARRFTSNALQCFGFAENFRQHRVRVSSSDCTDTSGGFIPTS